MEAYKRRMVVNSIRGMRNNMIVIILAAGLALLIMFAAVNISSKCSRWEEEHDNQGSV